MVKSYEERIEANRISNRRRRENRNRRIMENGGVVTAAKLLEIREATECFYCGVELNLISNPPIKEHYIPLALGGPDDDSNLVAACAHCNLSKGTKHPNDFVPQKPDSNGNYIVISHSTRVEMRKWRWQYQAVASQSRTEADLLSSGVRPEVTRELTVNEFIEKLLQFGFSRENIHRARGAYDEARDQELARLHIGGTELKELARIFRISELDVVNTLKKRVPHDQLADEILEWGPNKKSTPIFVQRHIDLIKANMEKKSPIIQADRGKYLESLSVEITIRSTIEVVHLPHCVPPRVARNLLFHELINKLISAGCSISDAYTIQGAYYKTRDQEVVRLYDDGFSLDDIAQALRISKVAISKAFRRHQRSMD